MLRELLGLEQGADQTPLGEGLRAQTPESLRAWHRLHAELVDWSSPPASPARWLHAGQAELFFDDTEVEVEGHKSEEARRTYEALAL